MNEKLVKLLAGQEENHMLPFFWLHGEDEATLREYMNAIDHCNIKAVCLESRPHPDYCGSGWWHDVDIILDEAKKRDMKVWILDDSHFPTGFANGAMAGKPVELRRQSITYRKYVLKEGETLTLSADELRNAGPFKPTQLEEMFQKMDGAKVPETFDDDRFLGVYAVSEENPGERIELAGDAAEGLCWQAPAGSWRVMVLNLTRNRGPHRNYINMMDAESVRVLIDAVYEPHWAHYQAEFGKTIEGFFSDEPEIGNGHLYEAHCELGAYDEEDYPWSRELEALLKEKLGAEYPGALTLLWDNDSDPDERARVRYLYMDCVTELVKKDFSYQLGDWCRAHGVKYIGHLIEDNNQHARTGSSLGHYFRGLAGEDWAGVDDIGGQVYPQWEDVNQGAMLGSERIGEFYHYMLGKLASSAAAIEPLKKGNSMCEVFGAYGWSEGVRLEKYLLDHLMVRGLNHFVPHAFSAKAFPDPDCPPHFYAHGHNPQYRHFSELMAYGNRVCTLISDGKHIAPAAVLYHGEAEWMGKTDYSHKIGRRLADAQVEYDYLPAEVFSCKENYRTEISEKGWFVNGQRYEVLLVPKMEYLTEAAIAGIQELGANGIPVLFAGAYPVNLPKETYPAPVDEDAIPEILKTYGIGDLFIEPEDNRIRFIHYVQPDGTEIYMFVNEGTNAWEGSVRFAEGSFEGKHCSLYDAWKNEIYAAAPDGESLKLRIEPLHSRIVLVTDEKPEYDREPLTEQTPGVTDVSSEILKPEWERSLCQNLEYPSFGEKKTVALPDQLETEQPLFSGIVRYEQEIEIDPAGEYLLVIEDAAEGVEVFVNGQSLGIQIVPPFRYELSAYLKAGRNVLAVEVATTLEREMSQFPGMFGQKAEPKSQSGITGKLKLYRV